MTRMYSGMLSMTPPHLKPFGLEKEDFGIPARDSRINKVQILSDIVVTIVSSSRKGRDSSTTSSWRERQWVESGMQNPRLPLGEDLVVGHVPCPDAS